MSGDGQYRKGGKSTFQCLTRKPVKKKFILKGNAVWAYSITWLACLMNVHSMHLRNMERKGLLPPPLLRDPDDARRWYLPEELIGYSTLYKKYKPKPRQGYANSEFKTRVWAFNARLREKVIGDPENVANILPDESTIYGLMTSKARPQSAWKKEVQRFMDDEEKNNP